MSKVNEMNLNRKCPTHLGTEKEFGSSLLKYTNENVVHLQHFLIPSAPNSKNVKIWQRNSFTPLKKHGQADSTVATLVALLLHAQHYS